MKSLKMMAIKVLVKWKILTLNVKSKKDSKKLHIQYSLIW